jgi:hypothetical protein
LKEDGAASVDGDIYHEPLPDNSDHAVVTGKANSKKVSNWSDLFQ